MCPDHVFYVVYSMHSHQGDHVLSYNEPIKCEQID